MRLNRPRILPREGETFGNERRPRVTFGPRLPILSPCFRDMAAAAKCLQVSQVIDRAAPFNGPDVITFETAGPSATSAAMPVAFKYTSADCRPLSTVNSAPDMPASAPWLARSGAQRPTGYASATRPARWAVRPFSAARFSAHLSHFVGFSQLTVNLP